MKEHERHVLMPLFYIFLHKGGILCQKIKNTTDDLNFRHIMHKRVERALKSVDVVF